MEETKNQRKDRIKAEREKSIIELEEILKKNDKIDKEIYSVLKSLNEIESLIAESLYWYFEATDIDFYHKLMHTKIIHFGAKCILLRWLKIINDEEAADLRRLGEIRNSFAHKNLGINYEKSSQIPAGAFKSQTEYTLDITANSSGNITKESAWRLLAEFFVLQDIMRPKVWGLINKYNIKQ